MPIISRNTPIDHVEDLAKINPLPDLTESQRRQQKMQCINNPLDTSTLLKCVTINDTDNRLNINTLPDCVTNNEKQRANTSVEKEIPVSDHMTNRRTQCCSFKGIKEFC